MAATSQVCTISLWSTHLASSHLSSLSTSPSPLHPPSQLSTLLALSLADPSPLPISTVLSLSILCPWESYEPLQELFSKGKYEETEVDETAKRIVEVLVGEVEKLSKLGKADRKDIKNLGGALKALKILHSLVKLSPSAISPLILLHRSTSSSSTSPLLPSLVTLYPLLPHLHSSLSLLHLLSILLNPPPSTTTTLSALHPTQISSTLPPSDPSAPPPQPFNSLWADFETLYSLSPTLISLSQQPASTSSHLWQEIAFRLVELEGSPEDFHAVAAAREAEEGREERELKILESVKNVLPDLREEFVRAAVKHSSFSNGGGEGVGERIVQSVLDGSVPVELVGLMAEPMEEEEDEYVRIARERRQEAERNTGVGSIDFGRLRVGKEAVGSSPLPLSDNMRESILRLAKIQEEEALQDEQDALEHARAGVVAYGGDLNDQVKYDGLGGDASRIGTVGPDGEEYEEEPLEEGVRYRYTIGGEGSDDEEEPEVIKGAPSIKKTAVINTETILEEAYVYNRKIFDQDATTRRSAARKAIEEQTGLDQNTFEAWKTILERAPRRLAALLERHEFSANTNHLVPVEHNSNSRGRGGRGGGGGGGGGRGRGGGGERGRGSNKSSRGHQNQARVRGHDKKMRNGGGSGGGAPPASAI